MSFSFWFFFFLPPPNKFSPSINLNYYKLLCIFSCRPIICRRTEGLRIERLWKQVDEQLCFLCLHILLPYPPSISSACHHFIYRGDWSVWVWIKKTPNLVFSQISRSNIGKLCWSIIQKHTPKTKKPKQTASASSFICACYYFIIIFKGWHLKFIWRLISVWCTPQRRWLRMNY